MSCKPRDHVAIIIPYRDRQEHLDILLQNLHPFLQSQKCHYQIFVVEQALPAPYNLGYTRNVGFVEASATFNFTCYIFHDVDKIPMNNSLLYRCPPDRVLHLASAEDRNQYDLMYPNYIGGVIGTAPDTFKKLNGFPNNYIRWGGEDDDFFQRSVSQKVPIEHAHTQLGMYRVLNHTRPPGYDNKEKGDMNQFASKLYKHYGPLIDGLNTLNYTRLATEYRPTYTWIKFNFDQKSMMKTVWKGIMDAKYDKMVNNTYWAVNYTRANEMFPKINSDIKREAQTSTTKKRKKKIRVRKKSRKLYRH
ncbi:beta-1,4-galactosyltransferase 4 [Lingula anatina]|uniref:Beta-1,4-galactosyltransferase n=1 Tax=Lingula anatina TaxID=7574 RepID=A0A1S3HZS2_LINAN|nr:beta-1,4-galactosyltransferase 4 [Lingula anatina]|eukprot:XP_013391513.1 beta-1,4-galactosyltransferase 4 [Lingula anatina]